MQFGISIPQHVDQGRFDPVSTRAYLTRAEELGFDSAWTGEQVLGSASHLAPIEMMTWAAACTSRIRLGCSVLVSPLYSPVHLAKSIASVDQLSLGRVEIGVGTGGQYRMFSAFDVDPTSLIARFNEGLALMRALWTEPRVTFEGRFWQLRDAAMEPKPVQQPSPPIWFGGGHPAALARAARHADGFFGAGSSTTAQFVEHVRLLRAALADADRAPSTMRIAKRIYIAVDDDAARAEARVRAALHAMYGYFGLPDLTPVAVFGPPEACVSGVRDVIEAGADLVLLNPLFDDHEQMERLAAEVVPALR